MFHPVFAAISICADHSASPPYTNIKGKKQS